MTAVPSELAAHHLASTALERLVAIRDGGAMGKARAPLDKALASARESFAASLDRDLPISAIVARAAMSAEEAEAFAIATAIEADERLSKLVVHLLGDRDRHRLEVGLLGELLGIDSAAVDVGPSSRPACAGLLSVDDSPGLSRGVIRVAPRVMWALARDRSPDPALPASAELVTVEGAPAGEYSALLVTGLDRARRRQAAARHTGGACLVAPAPATDEAWAALVREATLAGATVVIETDINVSDIGRRWIERAHHLRWAISSRAPLEIRTLPRLDWHEIEVPNDPPSDEEWAAVVGGDQPRSHPLSAQQLDDVRIALAAHDGDLDAAVRRLVSPKLDVLARHIRPSHTWDDLILPPGHATQLRRLVDRYKHADQVYGEWHFPAVPSRGLVALFSGPSGTGKTLAAEIVAGELGLDLYKLDLSSIVSKWVGETEKNLDELFEAAGAGNLVLFFDEADALFGKRSDVSDSHDRYANLETSYLLQRLESYDGVVVMATNYEKNIDQAFMRRIHVRVDFTLPDERERVAIWRRHLQTSAPLASDIDLDWLAGRFEMPGAAIRNAVVDAAFRTAAGGGEIDMEALVLGLAHELRKLGRLIRSEDFGKWYKAVSTEAGDTTDLPD